MNVITSFTSTAVIAANVLLTAPFVIVAVTTPLVAVAIVFTSAADDVLSTLTASFPKPE